MTQTTPLNLVAPPQTGFPLFHAGFRPFFLLAAIGGAVMMGLWLAIYSGVISGGTGYFDPLTWHHHEMIYGYTLAVIAGFLLTAVSNWTGRPTLSGKPLATLAMLWVAGRVVPWCGALPHGLIAAVDVAFTPALMIAIAIPLIRSGNRRNMVFIALLTTLTAGNLLVHLQALGVTSTGRLGAMLGLYLVLAMISLIGGRVIPFFIERRLENTSPRRWPRLGIAAVLTLIVLCIVDLSGAPAGWTAAAAWACAALHGLRLIGWHERRVWSVPLLWVLFLGYAWVVAGFALRALAAGGMVSPFVAVHAWTVGGIGVMTLGMMARVSLGHTGRPMRASTTMAIAFAVMNLAAVLRVAGPIAWPHHTLGMMRAAGLLWILALGLFAVVYTPILLRARPDPAS